MNDEQILSRQINIPAPLSTFIGREKEISKVKGLISENRLVTLTGPGGSGKTRLALKVSNEFLEKFKNRVWFIELASITNPGLIPKKIASTLNIREHPDHPIPDTLVNYFSTHPTLLILDNCEHLIEASAENADTLLQKCSDLRILATSREVLGITGEVTWTVPPLSLPDVQPWRGPESAQDALDVYQKSESVQLFCDRARANDPNFQMTSQNGAWVAEICRRLDGMPLAIELASARLRTLSAQQIAERLDDRFNLLTGGSRTAPSRQQTLAAVIEWSYVLLSEKEQKLLQRFSVFPGGGTLEAIEHICTGNGVIKNEVLEVLSQLVDKSLVTASQRTGKKRYFLLETIREFALGKLGESQEMKSTKDQLLDFFLRFAEDAEHKIKGPEQLTWYERLETEHDNLRAALGWALESQNAEAGLRLAGSLGFFWFVRGHMREAVGWLEKVLEQKGGASSAAVAKALRFLGSILIFSENKDFKQISELLEKSLELYKELDDRSGIAWDLNQLGLIAMIQGELTEAQRLFEESLALRKEEGDPWEIAQTLGNFFSLSMRQNDHRSAREFAERALIWFQRAEDQRGIARIRVDLAWIAKAEGDFTDAAVLLKKALTQLVQFGDYWSCAEVLEGLASLAGIGGDFKRGTILFGAAEALREEVGMPPQAFEYDILELDIDSIQKGLGEKAFHQAWAQGRALTLEQAVQFVSHEPETPIPAGAKKGRAGGLTRRELEAAILIAEGMSNREIAEAMTVTEKTVEAYVTRTLRKLGFDSRVQIATWVVENELG